jgi:hypothetical protein
MTHSSPDSAETGDDAIRAAALETVDDGHDANLVRRDGDLFIYYSGFNLSKFIRFLALRSAPAQGVRLEARPADDSQEWTEIFPAQLQWAAKEGHQVRAIETGAPPQPAPANASVFEECAEIALEHVGDTDSEAYGEACRDLAEAIKLRASNRKVMDARAPAPKTASERIAADQAYETLPAAVPQTARNDFERVFQDACDEIGCSYDNEALLKGIADLKAVAAPLPEGWTQQNVAKAAWMINVMAVTPPCEWLSKSELYETLAEFRALSLSRPPLNPTEKTGEGQS